MLVFGHDCVAKMLILFVKGGGAQQVMTVLFIRENVDNYGRPLTMLLFADC